MALIEANVSVQASPATVEMDVHTEDPTERFQADRPDRFSTREEDGDGRHDEKLED